ncbi:MAG: chromophore lyase CpcT/CpeT [Cytophagales bacterium]|nr:chromophore lyase CpcT/CpeT [Bernardetiaceae bacterium]MDW8210153.1 chromophore lyase CpcT/CpeT [Cytophagales bacterium]
MRNIVGLLAIALSATSLMGQQLPKPKTTLQQDLDTMMVWFAGEFDNFLQVWLEKRDSVKPELIHEHIHSIFAPVEVPAFGKNVFYVKQYMDGDPKKIYRQRLYHFSIDAAEKAIRLDIYSFPVDSLYYDAHLQPEKLRSLTPNQLINTPGCAVFWKRNGDHFIGYMKPKACHFVSKRTGKRIYITDSLKLTPQEIWIRDEAEDEDGNYVFGHKAKIPHKLKRVKYYTGWMVVQNPLQQNQYFTMRNLRLHNQGDKVRFVTEKGEPTKYWLELSEVVYGKDLNVLKLAIYEDGKPEAIAYTWGTPDAKRLGLNMRTLQAGVTLENYK